MSDFDVNRALAILNRASENGMYDATKIPESDADKIAAAEQTVQLCQQVETVVQAAFPGETDERIIAQKVPHWPGVVRTLAEAHVFVGANEPSSVAPDLLTVEEDNPPSILVAPKATEGVIDPANPPAVQESEPAGHDPSPVGPNMVPDQGDPQNGEIWLDQRGNAWLIVSYSGGTSAEVKSMKSGEATIVPAGFLKRRDASQETSDYADPPAADPIPAVDQDVMYQVQEISAQGGLVGELFSKVSDDLVKAPEPSAQPQDPGDEGHEPLSSAPPYAPPPSPEERQQVAEHVSDPDSTDLPPPIVSASWEGVDVDSSPSADIEKLAEGVRAETDRMNKPITDAAKESAKYDDLVENVEQRYRPAGMPVPTDLVDPPTISSEQFADIDDATARILHARFNALAARAKYLHDVEAAIARECDLVKTYHMRRAMAAARRELGKDATVAEVKILAEGDQIVYKWADYSRIHSEEAKALKTFHDIYTQHVVVLSRDWSMREAQVR